jgi:calcineurin-like phosphoesterase family protein
MIHFTADLHLNHVAILKHQSLRGQLFGDDILAMDAAIIDGINAAVGRNDELWILGDFCWQAAKAGHYRQRIKARQIHIVQGNHDSSSLRKHVSSMSLMEYRKFGDIKIHMSHYPLASWRAREHGSIHLYGHSHGMMEKALDTMWPSRRSMDVGMDEAYRHLGAWRPFSLDEIKEILL